MTNDPGALPFGPAGRPATPDRTTDGGTGRFSPDLEAVTVAAFADYASAQRAVDHLADQRFPVERVRIVGTDLRLVEQVLGRMTVARAALAGAGTGGWFGLLIGVLLGVFAVDTWWRVLVFAIVAGVAWGAVFGALAHAMTGGRRDFSSASALQASRYAIQVDRDAAEEAAELLDRMGR